MLQSEVAAVTADLEQLKEEWEEYKKPISDEIFTEKQAISDKRVEYGYKQEKIASLKKEFKQALAEAEHKKAVLEYLQQQWEALPKDSNRATYLTQTNDLIKRLKVSNGEIRASIADIKEIKDTTHDRLM